MYTVLSSFVVRSPTQLSKEGVLITLLANKHSRPCLFIAGKHPNTRLWLFWSLPGRSYIIRCNITQGVYLTPHPCMLAGPWTRGIWWQKYLFVCKPSPAWGRTASLSGFSSCFHILNSSKKNKEKKEENTDPHHFPGRNVQGAAAGCDRADDGRCIIKAATVSMAFPEHHRPHGGCSKCTALLAARGLPSYVSMVSLWQPNKYDFCYHHWKPAGFVLTRQRGVVGLVWACPDPSCFWLVWAVTATPCLSPTLADTAMLSLVTNWRPNQRDMGRVSTTPETQGEY